MEQGGKTAKSEARAKPRVARKGHKGKGSAVPDFDPRLAEAFAQHAAIAEILRVMSASPGDVQRVLDAIAERAARLCESPYARVLLVDGEVLRLFAEYSLDGTPQGRTVPLPLKRTSIAGRAVVDCATIHHDDVVPLLESEYPGAVNARRLRFRAVLGVPLMREREAYGVIFLFRREPRPYSPEQIALVQTFAQQAAIAIDNARLFNETKEALEQQTAISEILRVIASSPGALKPMLKAVVERALKLCDAADATIFLLEGDKLRAAARFGSALTPLEVGDFMPLTRGSVTGRAVIDRSVVHIEDLATVSEDDFPVGRAVQRRLGHHTALSVPLMREDHAIGAIALWRMEVQRFTDKQIALVETFADQAAIAIENVRLFDEVQARTRELSESLQQQTATADVLKVISRSAFDLQTVLDTLTESACKLCEAEGANILRPDADGFKVAAMFGQSPAHKAALKQLVIKPARSTCAGRALLERRTVQIRDAMADREYNVPDVLKVAGNRAMIGVPLLREGVPIGVLVLTRTVARPFTNQQIALATTFADQAVIAIENVRLFKETKEALEQQTATSEILRVIASSPGDVQPMLSAVVERAAKLCEAANATIFLTEGDKYRSAARFGSAKRALELGQFIPLTRGSAPGRAIIDRTTIHLEDLLAVPENEYPMTREWQRVIGHRTLLAVPLMREDRAIGALALWRLEVRSFTEKQIALVRTFADQAAIAIDNVRLFNETKEALERQTATSEILRVISQSPRDVQPVFDTIVKSAVRLCEARFGAVFRLDGGLVHLAAHHNFSGTLLARFQKGYPMAPNRGHVSGRAILTGTAVQVPDILADEEYLGGTVKAAGFRSLLGVPLLRGGRAIGAIVIYRAELGPFADKHIELLRTFADQAVIAIENVRLFTELEARTAQLTRSVGELKALGEVGQAVSSTLDLETVLSTIVSRAAKLAGMDGGSIWEYDEAREEFHLHATDRLPQELVDALKATPIRKGEGALGRMAMAGEPVEIGDIADEPTYQSRVRDAILRCGFRSVLTVPLLREDRLLGGLAVIRKTAGEFAPQVIDLLKTFATQSALAIQNARLFREIEVKSRQLEVASQHKSEFLANMSHELRTPLNAIIGFSEVLSQRMFGEINDKQAEYLGDILESGQHLLSLINDILDLSKIEAGRMELELTEFDLSTAIENTLILVRERAQRHGVTLGRTVDDRLGSIHGDERKVKQVLLNLLSNALKFTPEGGQIDVRAEVREGMAEISVRDTGVGIAPEDQEAVFEEFRQVGTASKKVEGTGLGLAISRKFIALHGGRIWVNSQLGVGSTFTFTLPLKIAPRHETS